MGKLKIVTVNLPVSYLKAIEALTGKQGLYPSRSELIRVAVRDFLIRELDTAKTFAKLQHNKITAVKPARPIDDKMFVQVPMTDTTSSLDGGAEYRTYRIIKR